MSESSGLIDDNLPLRLANGDIEAHREFIHGFSGLLRRYFVRRGMSDGEAEDLAISCVSEAALKIEKYRVQRPGGFKQWVYSIAHRRFLDWLRKQPEGWKRVEFVEELVAAVDETAQENELCRVVSEVLSRLSDRDQRLIHLRDFGVPMTFEEIGREMGISKDAAKMGYHRARKHLESLLRAHPEIDEFVNDNQSTVIM